LALGQEAADGLIENVSKGLWAWSSRACHGGQMTGWLEVKVASGLSGMFDVTRQSIHDREPEFLLFKSERIVAPNRG
jgi:hypothetical protein